MSEKSCNFAAPNANEHIMVSIKINTAFITTRPHGNSLEHRDEFEMVCNIIATHRKRVIRAVNQESLSMVWEIGGYVSHKLKTSI